MDESGKGLAAWIKKILHDIRVIRSGVQACLPKACASEEVKVQKESLADAQANGVSADGLQAGV